VTPFVADVDEKGEPKDAWQGVVSRMVALTIAEKFELCPGLAARFFPLVTERQGKRVWAIPQRPWTEREVVRFRADDYEPDIVVFGVFSAAQSYRLTVEAFDVRGRFFRFRKTISGVVDVFLNDFEQLLLDMFDALGETPADVNLRRRIGRFGTRDWLAWRCFLAGKSGAMGYALGLDTGDSRRPYEPFVEAFTRDATFQEAAEHLALLSLEIVLNGAGDAGPAVKALRKAVHTFPDHFKLYGALGFCYRKMGYRQDAQLAWERCIALDEGHQSTAETLFQLGCLFEENGEFDAARLRYEAALCEKNDHCDAHDRLAFALANLGDLDGAIRHWQRVVELDPRRSATFGHLGWAYQEKGWSNEARQTYEKGIKNGEPAWSVYFHYATFLVRHDEARHAIGILEQAHSALGEAAWIHERLGAAYLVLGEGQLAHEHLAKAVTLDPDGDFGKSASRALHEIGRLGGTLSKMLSRIGGTLRSLCDAVRRKRDA